MPGENKDTVEETQKQITKYRRYIDYLNLATMVPLPGTPIVKNPDAYNVEIINFNPSKLWIVNHETSDDILIKNKDVPLDEMIQLKKNMYQFMRDAGYSRPEWRN